MKALRNVYQMHFEVSRACNLSCTYCYADPVLPVSSSFMPEDIALRYIDLVLGRTCSTSIEFVFHGGEPLLQSETWFENVMKYGTRRADGRHKNVRFLMQSNGTVLPPEKLDVMIRHRVLVGVSLDGPPRINEMSRGKTDLVLGNIEKLRESQCFGGAICVINKHNHSRITEVLAFLEALGIYWLVANPVHAAGRGRILDMLGPGEIFAAYVGIYEYLERTLGEAVLEANMAMTLTRFLQSPSLRDFEDILICSHPICGGGITMVFCDINGVLYPCGCSGHGAFALGSVDSVDDGTFVNRVGEFHTKPPKYFSECQLCDAAQICTFGCPAFDPLDPSTEASICTATRMLHSFLQQQDKHTIQVIVNNMQGRIHERRGYHAGSIC